jgi:hypothetical protein
MKIDRVKLHAFVDVCIDEAERLPLECGMSILSGGCDETALVLITGKAPSDSRMQPRVMAEMGNRYLQLIASVECNTADVLEERINVENVENRVNDKIKASEQKHGRN